MDRVTFFRRLLVAWHVVLPTTLLLLFPGVVRYFLILIGYDTRYQVLLALELLPVGFVLSAEVIRHVRNAITRVILAYLFAAISFATIHYLFYQVRPASYSIATAVMSQAELDALTALSRRARDGIREIGLLMAYQSWVTVQPEGPFTARLATRTGGMGYSAMAYRFAARLSFIHLGWGGAA